jgi:phosphohistidine phosphatase
MKGYFLKSKQKFDYVCSSTALRAAETIEIIKPALRNVDIMFDKALYTFDDEILIDIISKISDDHSSVLLVGHNPAIQETILRLSSSKSDNKSLEKIQNKYPTAAFCKLYSDISSWAHVGDTLFELVDFICPRDL